MSRTKAVFVAVFCSLGLSAVLGSTGASAGPPWGPETPNFNLEIILRSVDGSSGFSHVKFRQPNDAEKVVYLDTWVRDLTPNHTYFLQRAVDTTLDGNCTSTAWLTLGKGLTAQAITTDGTGGRLKRCFETSRRFRPGRGSTSTFA